MLLSYYDEAHFADKYKQYIENFLTVDSDIEILFQSLKSAIQTQKEIEIPNKWKAVYDKEAIKNTFTY